MPDWTYQTVFRPLLRQLAPATARRLALGSMGRLARLPLGKQVIRLMGHMAPDPRLAIDLAGQKFPARVGLGCGFDPHLTATSALAEFGFGFLEIGPISMAAPTPEGKIAVDEVNESISFSSPLGGLDLPSALARLHAHRPIQLPLFARLNIESKQAANELIESLQNSVDAFVVPIEQLDFIQQPFRERPSERLSCYAVVNAETWHDSSSRERCERAFRDGEIIGVVVDASESADGAHHQGKPAIAAAVATVRSVRAALGPSAIVIGAVGVHSPADALDYLEAGADLVEVNSGLIFAGPGLPKRINEALLYQQLARPGAVEPSQPPRAATESWFWAFLMGISMFVGGCLAMAIATTRVVLPYDETMAGLTRAQLNAINPLLLEFMRHDRVTLAGTMLAIGMLYMSLAYWGIRAGHHWAYVAVVASAFSGFFSFFSFLGFGYFDPFHAFVTVILFQFLLLTMHSHRPERRALAAPDLWNDRRWRAGQWGQLLFVIQGVALTVAGLEISRIGITSVFVPEDLEFMQTTASQLLDAHPQLVPLVAHDRATFGGMLIACGIATLLPALWGFQRGQAWLWWTLMFAGTIAYCATMMVHWRVGYHSPKHLLPAAGGLLLLWAAGIASYSLLAAPDVRLAEEWRRQLQRR